jgi:chromosome segregation ATPase
MYTIENQEKYYLQSQIHQLKNNIQKLKDSILFAEAKHYKGIIDKNEKEIEKLYSLIRLNDNTEKELILERNRFKEGKERMEREVLTLHQTLHDKDAVIELQTGLIHSLEKDLLKSELHNTRLASTLTQLEDLNKKLSSQNDQLMKDNKNLIIKSEGMKSQIKTQKIHISDLNNALATSENTKKEVFFDLLSKTEELEKLIAEREHTLQSLEEAKEQLIISEKDKMQYLRDMLDQYKKTIEENEWWFSTQFADIDHRTKKQEERLDSIEYEQEVQFTEQNKKIINQLEDVESKFMKFIEEIDCIRNSNQKMTDQLFELKHMVEKQKRSGTHIIQNRPVRTTSEHNAGQSKEDS